MVVLASDIAHEAGTGHSGDLVRLRIEDHHEAEVILCKRSPRVDCARHVDAEERVVLDRGCTERRDMLQGRP